MNVLTTDIPIFLESKRRKHLSRSLPIRWMQALLLCLMLLLGGCRTTQQAQPVMRPARHSIRSGQLLVLSDRKLPKDHPIIKDLINLRKQVAMTLRLPVQKEDVVVYIFNNEEEYRRYLDVTYPGLPRRRAYFVGTAKELAVYTYWGERIQEDLRHEYTHGLLHSSLRNVPLWLDEGLAEYFEVIGPSPGTVNADYANRLTASLVNGWRPNIERLEGIEEFSAMQHVDYQEAWAWVHFLLHSSPDTKDILLGYLKDLRTQRQPVPISRRLENALPNPQERFVNYVGTLPVSRLLSTQPRHVKSNGHQEEHPFSRPSKPYGSVRISSGNRLRNHP
ncbi:MAG: hypothetical protein Tsb009_19770 [Planctomycetaceae bacterium]